MGKRLEKNRPKCGRPTGRAEAFDSMPRGEAAPGVKSAPHAGVDEAQGEL